jgi:hypothetical protein
MLETLSIKPVNMDMNHSQVGSNTPCARGVLVCLDMHTVGCVLAL